MGVKHIALSRGGLVTRGGLCGRTFLGLITAFATAFILFVFIPCVVAVLLHVDRLLRWLMLRLWSRLRHCLYPRLRLRSRVGLRLSLRRAGTGVNLSTSSPSFNWVNVRRPRGVAGG